ncbi:MAG TPA: hypothetical protein VNT51_01180 [Miltoncostaeaceae bacterium]|nr:hypothetical protein [Miltoncostaeaceae bacterium]
MARARSRTHPSRRRLPVALTAAVALLGAPAAALATPWVIGAGDVHPPDGPERAIGASFGTLVRAWGPPEVAPRDVPVATWPRGLEVTFTRARGGASVKFLVSDRRWRTPSGARVGMTAAQLRRIYGRRLVTVPDRRGLLGVRYHLMVPAGRMALGFVLRRPGRVLWLVTGSRATVRADLAFAGPA